MQQETTRKKLHGDQGNVSVKFFGVVLRAAGFHQPLAGLKK